MQMWRNLSRERERYWKDTTKKFEYHGSRKHEPNKVVQMLQLSK